MLFHMEPRTIPCSVFVTDDLSAIPHLHRHMEIVYVRRGRSVAVAGNQQVRLEEGDLFIAFPNQIHYYLADPGAHQVILLIASPDLCPEFKHDFKHFLPVSPVYRGASEDPKITAALESILESDRTSGRFSEVEIKANLMLLLSRMLTIMPLQEARNYDNGMLGKILLYCYDNFTEDISLSGLAEALGVSPYYISHIFSKQLHLSFRDYINSLRIDRACEMLKSSEQTITQIAFAVGYNSTRTFNRCFLEGMKMTPKEYRRRIRQ